MAEKQPENIEVVPKLEWGPELGKISPDAAQTKIDELNSALEEGEKTWRLPTDDELLAKYKTYSVQGRFYLSARGGKVSGLWVGSGEPNIGYEGEHDMYVRLIRDVA